MCNKELITLISEYQSYDMKNFEGLWDAFKRLIKSYALQRGDGEAEQDLAGFFAELLFNIDLSRFAPDRSDGLMRYIAVCIRNEHIRLCKSITPHLPLEEDIGDKPSERGLSVEERLFLKECLDSLSEAQRRVLILRYIEGYSDSEIAALLHISRQAVGRLRSRAVQSIRKKFRL